MVYLAELYICIDILFQNGQNLCLKCAPRKWTQALRRRRHWMIAASTMDWSNCAHSILTKMQRKNYPYLITFSVEYSSIEYLNHNKSCAALRRIDDANASNLILIIRPTVLCNNLEHLLLT